MSLLKAYLRNSKTQGVLSRKPGDKGFSLIELVVVVAVLAILAAIAIPRFGQLSDDARLNSAKSILANMYKECEFNDARTNVGFHTAGVANTPGGVTWARDAAIGANDGTGCDGPGDASMAISATQNCVITLNFATGDKSHTGLSNSTTAWPDNFEDC